MTSCPFCENTDIRKEAGVIYRESEIKGVRETCNQCYYTRFIANKGEKHDSRKPFKG